MSDVCLSGLFLSGSLFVGVSVVFVCYFLLFSVFLLRSSLSLRLFACLCRLFLSSFFPSRNSLCASLICFLFARSVWVGGCFTSQCARKTNLLFGCTVIFGSLLCCRFCFSLTVDSVQATAKTLLCDRLQFAHFGSPYISVL